VEAADNLLASASRSAPRGSGKGWKRLRSSKPEVEQIVELFHAAFPSGRVDALGGAEATENSLLQQAPRHQILHLATHGYFAPPGFLAAGKSLRNRQLGQALEDRQAITGLHPGLLSGLVMAGANRPVGWEGDDGVLTALEVGELDLTHTDLAVLSACQTGLGKSAAGEGLLGLQRAFQVAGCGTVVASLWNVYDAATQALMVDFYKELWSGKPVSRAEALRRAQLNLLRGTSVRKIPLDPAWPADEGGRLPPRYWAAFVLSGDWR